MQQNNTEVDRKLAIYYHPLFQQAIILITDLFLKIYTEDDDQRTNLQPQNSQSFNLGLMEFIEFNLKLQKCLLPSFQAQNAIISGLNDWVKEVAQCLNFDGMIVTSQCQQINDSNFQQLLRAQIVSSRIPLYESKQKYIRTLSRLKNHDAFKLLGVKINKQVFSKFMFDLCSTWCQFLDIEMFVYFLLAIYLQVSEGFSLSQSSFKSTHLIQTIELQFMQEFEQIKQNYSKNKKKELRYYRAWCEWNYLRVGEVGESLILCLDSIIDDSRVLEMAEVFEKAIKVINQEITSQSQQQTPNQTITIKQRQNHQQDFLILKKIQAKQLKTALQAPPSLQHKQKSIEQPEKNIENSISEIENLKQKNFKKNSIELEGSIPIHSRNQTIQEDQFDSKNIQQKMETNQYINQRSQIEEEGYQHHDFQIQIDEFGNMFLKRIVKLPIFGQKIEPLQFERKNQLQFKWIQNKTKQCRQVSNLYRRLENLKIRLEHKAINDSYVYKKKPLIADRDRFYDKTQNVKLLKASIQEKTVNQPQPVLERSIHQKVKPQQGPEQLSKQSAKPSSKVQGYLSMGKTGKLQDHLRNNDDYIHKIIAPPFLTNYQNNISFTEKQGNIYGINAQQQRRDLKVNLPKIKFLNDYKVKEEKPYHIIGKLTKDRAIINQKVKSYSLVQDTFQSAPSSKIATDKSRIDHLKNEYQHIWVKHISEEEINELTNFTDFYRELKKFKLKFSREHQSQYRKNLKPILLYQNLRCEMGGEITRKQEERFYQKMKKLVNLDERRKKRKERKLKFRLYKKSFRSKKERSFYEEVFINYHKSQIKNIRQQRQRIKSQIVQIS